MKTILLTIALTIAGAVLAQSILPDIVQTTSADLAKQSMEQVVERGNASILSLADSTAAGMANVWKPVGYTSAEALAALGTNAQKIFNQHAAVVGYLWTDPLRRAALVAACQRHNVQLTTDGNGAPVFGDRLPITLHPDGSITLAN